MRPLPLLKRRPRRLPPPGASKIKTHSRLFAGKTRRPFAITTKKRKKLLILALFLPPVQAVAKIFSFYQNPFGKRFVLNRKLRLCALAHTPSRPALLPVGNTRGLRGYVLSLACAHTPRCAAMRSASPARIRCAFFYLSACMRQKQYCNVFFMFAENATF